MTIFNKKGKAFEAKIDSNNVDKVKAAGTWFAEWNKDFNSYLVQNISAEKTNKKAKPLKQSLHTFLMDVPFNVPVKHLNEDNLDNRMENLQLFNRNEINEIEEVNDSTIAIILKDKFGNKVSKALISPEDLNKVITDEYSWVNYKFKGEPSVVANTPEGRVFLDELLMSPASNEKIHHINLNPLDNRRENLELVSIEA